MSWVEIFVRRPVATTLLAVGLALPGVAAYVALPVASLPQVDFPTIGVSAGLPGAAPETMAATVATPLERSLGRIAGVTEMTSSNTQGATRLNLQFDLDRDIDGAARDVQSAINASRSLLPSSLPSSPTYRKANAASGPILAIALTSPTRTQDQLYDVAFTTIGQRIAQVRGVGQVSVNGSSLRSVRVECDPLLLAERGVSLEDVRAVLQGASADLPKGFVEADGQRFELHLGDRALHASDFESLIVRSQGGAELRLSDVARVLDAVQEVRNAGSSGGQPAVMLAVMNQPGANIVETVDAVRALLPRLDSLVPSDVDVRIVIDRSTTIRRSLREVEEALLLSVALVVLVTFLFLKSARSTLIPTVAVPVALLATVAGMRFCGFSLNNLSLMALIISTGFVVDDAIVVLENAASHMDRGMSAPRAAVRAVKDVGFTVVAMSLSLVAVFMPLLLMGGVVGRLFSEFAVTLAIAVVLSMVVSLTLTPMLCSRWLTAGHDAHTQGWAWRCIDACLSLPARLYRATLGWALRQRLLMVGLLLASVASTVQLYRSIPKGFFPQQDTGRLQGFFRADQSVSFTAMRQKVSELMAIVGADPDVVTFYEYGGGAAGAQYNTGSMYALLRPRSERHATADEVVARLRPKLSRVAGASLVLTAQQDLNIGARQGGGQYQYTLLASDLGALASVAGRFRAALSKLPQITDVTSDFQDKGLQVRVIMDRDAAARQGISASDVDVALNDAFGQRIVSNLYEPLNQYSVVLTLAPEFTRDPVSLDGIYLRTAGGAKVPLSSVAHYEVRNAPLAVNHQGQYAAATFSFNLVEGVDLQTAAVAIGEALDSMGHGGAVRGTFAGTAQALLDSLANQPWLVFWALVAVYVVLGILYESFLHPLTVLSTLPSAGLGALVSLWLTGEQFSIIALVGVVLLVGIVMKNAIILIDAALQHERETGAEPSEAIRVACVARFRPILMTTLAALFGALPLALGAGDGAELRRPLGIAIVGGLIGSQLLTLYTTPVVYSLLVSARANTRAAWVLLRRSWVSSPARP